MKKLILSFFVLFFLCFPSFSLISFEDVDLNDEGNLIFTLNCNNPGGDAYSSLFLAKIEGGKKINPKIMTCYPERMELLNDGKILQVRNRYGKAKYDCEKNTFDYVERVSGIPENSMPVSYYSTSPDGKWYCYIEKTDFSTGNLLIENALTGKSSLIAENTRLSFENLPVKWCPDSSVLLYEKNESVYFCSPDAMIRGVEVDEQYRKICDGKINVTEWASDKTLVYIDDYLVYRLNAKELYTTGLYSAIIGRGTVSGRIPFKFNFDTDRFSVSPDSLSLVIIQNERIFTYFKSKSFSAQYMDIIYSRPYADNSSSLVNSYIFWNKENKPVMWLEKLPYDGSAKKGSVYNMESSSSQILEIEDSGKPFISSDGSLAAFFAGSSVYVYDINSWKQIGILEGEKIVSAVWSKSDVLYIGGEKSIRKWNVITNETETIALSSAQKARWNSSGKEIIAVTGDSFYTFENNSKSLKKINQTELPESKKQNGQYRVFIGKAINSKFKNALYLRTLSNSAKTVAVYSASIKKSENTKKAALVFDAYDNADGLSYILQTLNKFYVKGTFFLNGEFIRRYPSETSQIVKNGYECASMFFSTVNLTKNSFVIDEDFIRRGLARNEDEFYSTTKSELSLYWHAPYYKETEEIKNAAKKSGYSYVDCPYEFLDFENENQNPEELIYKYCSYILENGSAIIPIPVGYSEIQKNEPLYEYLELLIFALIDNKIEIVEIQDL